MEFRLDEFLKRHAPAAGSMNLDAFFSDPARKGKLLEMPSNLPDAVVAAIKRNVDTIDFNRYPVEAAADLRTEIANWLDLPSEHTAMFGNGAFAVIDLVIQSFAPGAKALTLDPDSFMYRLAATKHGIAMETHPLEPTFDIVIPALADRIGAVDPDLIVLSNPHNPTAALFGTETIEAILKRARGLVLIDEVYAAFAPHPNDCLALLGRYPNLMILRSFSKVGAAAIRLGFLVGHRRVLDRIGGWQNTFAVSSISMMIAGLIIRHYDEIEKYVRSLIVERDRMVHEFGGFAGVTVYPSSTNFVVLRLEDQDVEPVHAHLFEQGLPVLHYRGNSSLNNCLRFSVDTPANNTRMIEQFDIALSTGC